MRKRYRPKYDDSPFEEPLINLTPLIDVVFVVLITFMLVAPILNIDSVDLAMGKSTTPCDAKSSISISVHADNTLWHQNRKVSLKELEAILKIEKKKHPRQSPQVAYDKSASFGTYQTIKNLLEQIGFEQMDIVLKPG